MMMKHTRLIILFLLLITGSALSAQNDSLQQTSANINQDIQQFYQSLSYTDFNTAAIDSIKSFFTADAILHANFGATLRTWTVPQFIAFIKDGYAKQSITTREESELFEKTDVFGNIAQRFSTYKIRFTINGKIEERRGINAMQLLKINGRWLISSLIWDIEKASSAIPRAYLPNK